ncbi:hypothetical protein [Streptomyces ipomoeae]|uniref:hypothetical protein n=1 Tax=Streptomyces ipomoeae TaxID=103232 RepID=UPI00215C65A8|nr:hypothetical protein [Streptomyces ipomoeae]
MTCRGTRIDHRACNPRVESIQSTAQASVTPALPSPSPAAAAGGGTAGFPVDFTLQTRADGAASYTTVRTVTGQPDPGGAAQAYTLTSATGRYLRLRATRLGKPASGETSKYRLQLAEIRVK